MAYAAVVSLMQTIERLLINPFESKILIPKSEMEFISEELSYLQSFLETIRFLPSSKRVDSLERQVESSVHSTEDLIESHISSDPCLADSEISGDESFTLALSRQLLKVRQEIGSFTERLKAEEECSTEDQQQSNSFAADAVSSGSDSGLKKKMVGLDYELMELQDWVLSGPSELDLMLVFGMAGIGKTTFVKQVYCDPLVIQHFDHRLFVPIGPQYWLKKTLLSLLDQVDKMHEEVDEELLGGYVYKSLIGKKYLIVLDDIWGTEVWKELEQFFPSEEMGSRIVFTARLVDVFDADNLTVLRFLNGDESWDLLHEMVFTTEERCNPQLEKIGRKIAKKCEGLPLAIIEVGKLLCKIEKTVEKWELVAEAEDPLIIRSDDNTPLSEALSLSYRMLPQYLKVCFLYMGVFPKKYEISRSKLIKLWVSEGFLEPQKGKSLEEIAGECFSELLSRSVVLGYKLRSRVMWTIKTCRLHFSFRSLCVTEAKSEKFFHIINKYTYSLLEDINSQQRLCTHNNVVLSIKEVQGWMESVPSARSLLCYGPQQRYPVGLYLPFRLLKVLDALRIRFYELPDQVLGLVHLRYLAITCDGELPTSISCLWNLEVLIVHRHHNIKWSNFPVYLPIEIWKLHKLKHLQCIGFDLPVPDPSSKDYSIMLEKLLSLTGVSSHSCTVGVLARMPNLMKLGIQIESPDDSSVETFSFPCDITYLCRHLESFKCVTMNPCFPSRVVSSVPSFPLTLVKIALSGCGFSWTDMSVIAALPNLEVLKLRCYAFLGPEWRTYEGEFPQLKFLLLEDLNIERLISDSSHFPQLEHLIIRHCYKLRDMPNGIGYTRQLLRIRVDDCSPSVAISARKIQEYHPTCRIVYIKSSWDDKKLKP